MCSSIRRFEELPQGLGLQFLDRELCPMVTTCLYVAHLGLEPFIGTKFIGLYQGCKRLKLALRSFTSTHASHKPCGALRLNDAGADPYSCFMLFTY